MSDLIITGSYSMFCSLGFFLFYYCCFILQVFDCTYVCVQCKYRVHRGQTRASDTQEQDVKIVNRHIGTGIPRSYAKVSKAHRS